MLIILRQSEKFRVWSKKKSRCCMIKSLDIDKFLFFRRAFEIILQCLVRIGQGKVQNAVLY